MDHKLLLKDRGMKKSYRGIIKLHLLCGWYLCFGYSLNITGKPQIALFIGLAAMNLLLATLKRDSWVKQPELVHSSVVF